MPAKSQSQHINSAMLTETPQFRIGNIPIRSDLILAPMDGVSDLPFRQLTRGLGSAFSITEFINAIDVIRGHPLLEQRIAFSECERPFAYQLFDEDPDRLLQAALILQKYQPDFIDINMGCPAKTVAGRGAGAALMRAPRKVADIFSRLSRALDIPVTGKIRLGWDDFSRNYLEIARIVEENGGKCLAVHARTKEQAYSGSVDWEAIAQIKATLTIPVIGNGDVRTVEDIQRIKVVTGCDAVMIGRAAVENPWLFSRKNRCDVPDDVVLATMRQHFSLMSGHYGETHAMLLFRKFAKGYLKPYQLSRYETGKLLTTTSPEVFWQLVEQYLIHDRNNDDHSTIKERQS